MRNKNKTEKNAFDKEEARLKRTSKDRLEISVTLIGPVGGRNFCSRDAFKRYSFAWNGRRNICNRLEQHERHVSVIKGLYLDSGACDKWDVRRPLRISLRGNYSRFG